MDVRAFAGRVVGVFAALTDPGARAKKIPAFAGMTGWKVLGGIVGLMLVLAVPAAAETKPPAAASRLPANEKFTTVAAAQASCPADVVVWSSFTATRSFHLAKSKYFGKTKHGAFICEKVALAAGFHQSRT
jgi:hypothetical protein